MLASWLGQMASSRFSDSDLKYKAEKCLKKISDAGPWPPHVPVRAIACTHTFTHMTHREIKERIN